ncbi:MAG: hypothetical protein ACTFAK_00660 [Candidatus Electronema sp. VV]
MLKIKMFIERKQHDVCHQQAKAHIKSERILKMKAKKIITGAVAVLSFFALSATGVFAAGEVYCESGSVVATGAGHVYAGTTTIKPNLRSVTLTCATPVNDDWDGSERTFVIPATPDKDGIYAAALTALVEEGSTVAFYLSNSKAPSTLRGQTANGLIRLLHVK